MSASPKTSETYPFRSSSPLSYLAKTLKTKSLLVVALQSVPEVPNVIVGSTIRSTSRFVAAKLSETDPAYGTVTTQSVTALASDKSLRNTAVFNMVFPTTIFPICLFL